MHIWDGTMSLQQAVRDAEVLLPSNAPIDAAVMEAATKLLLIQQPAAGVDSIDREAVRERGIPLCNAPGGNHISVAEGALLLMLALARQLPRAFRSFRERRIGVPFGTELCGRIVGIIGSGHSGNALAERVRALGMTAMLTNSSSTASEFRELLALADIVSLHCPLTERTRGLINAEAVALMKPGALLINCARGPILDREAVTAALDSGHLGGLGLDTYWQEPWDPDDALYARDDVVALPHIAGCTTQSVGRIADMVCDNINRLRKGLPLRHRLV